MTEGILSGEEIATGEVETATGVVVSEVAAAAPEK